MPDSYRCDLIADHSVSFTVYFGGRNTEENGDYSKKWNYLNDNLLESSIEFNVCDITEKNVFLK